MPNLSHHTLGYSSPDLMGKCYSLSLDPGTAKRGERYCAYNACLRSQLGHTDPKNGKIATAKFPRHEKGSEQWTKDRIRASSESRRLALKFNAFLSQLAKSGEIDKVDEDDFRSIDGRQGKDGHLTFLIPQSNCLESVSFLDKKRKKGEHFVFEDKLKSYQTFVNSSGLAEDEGKGRARRNSSRKLSTSRKGSVNSTSSSVDNDDSDVLNGNVFVHNFGGLYPDLSETDGFEDSPPSYDSSQAHELHGVPLPEPSKRPVINNNININNNNMPPTQCLQHQESRSRTSSTNSVVDEHDLDHPYLQAFIHHSFCSSNCKFIVCNLKGSRDTKDGSYTLSTPIIHSLRQSYGSDDKGLSAVRRVIANHKCSRLCRHLPNMNDLLEQELR